MSDGAPTSSAFSASERAALEREVDDIHEAVEVDESQLAEFFDVDQCAKFVREGNFQQVPVMYKAHQTNKQIHRKQEAGQQMPTNHARKNRGKQKHRLRKGCRVLSHKFFLWTKKLTFHAASSSPVVVRLDDSFQIQSFLLLFSQSETR